METNYTYDAFISYRHADLDKFVAENLHKQLETFRLPLNVSRKKAKGTKTRINRIFRDKDELPIASDLASPIMTALQSSEFLIVICSPRAPQSQWVAREIDTFISMHGRDHILAVLIEGEPAESFPPALLEAEKEISLPDGSIKIEKIPVEPLAADVRGKDKHEVLKNIKKEILRLAAPMFHCGYDELKQRHRERRIKRTLRIMGAACLFFVLFGSFSTFQALRIQKQSKQINEQSQKIKQQYDEILVTSLTQEADKSFLLYDNGDRMTSMQTALGALPKDSSDTETPYITRAEHALSQSLRVYDNNSDVSADRILKHDTAVNFMKVSPDSSYILTFDETKTVHIWERETGKEISTIYESDKFSFQNNEDFFAFINNSTFIFADTNGAVKAYNYLEDTVEWEYHLSKDDSFALIYNMAVSNDLSLAAIADDSNNLSIISLTDGSLITSYTPSDSDDNSYYYQHMAFNSDNSLLAFTRNNMDASAYNVSIFNIDNQSVTEAFNIENELVMKLNFDQNHLFCSTMDDYDFKDFEMQDFISAEKYSHVYGYSLSEEKAIWSKTFSYQSIDTLRISPYDSSLIVLGSESMYRVDPESGEVLAEVNFGSPIVCMLLSDQNSVGIFIARNGEALSIDTENGYNYNPFFDAITHNLSDAIHGKGYFALLQYDGRDVYIYSQPENEATHVLTTYEEATINKILFSKDGSIMNSLSYGTPYYLYSTDYNTGEQINRYDLDSLVNDIFLAGEKDDQICVCFNEYVEFIDCSTYEVIKHVDFPENFSSCINICKDEAAHLLYVFRYDSYFTINLYSGDISKPVSYDSFAINTIYNTIVGNNKHIWLANTTNNSIEEYDASLSNILHSVTANTNYINNIFLNESGELLFAAYKNGVTEVYSTTDLSLLATYEDFVLVPNECISLTDGSGDYILMGEGHSYLCNNKHEIRAYLPHCSGFDTRNNIILSANYHDICTTPLYTLDMLREEAKKQLNSTSEAVKK